MAGREKFKEFFYQNATFGRVLDFKIVDEKKELTIRLNKGCSKEYEYIDHTFVDYGSDIQFDDKFEKEDLVQLLLLDDYSGTIKRIEKLWVIAKFDLEKIDIEKLLELESMISKLGIYFDRSASIHKGKAQVRDWELDWSLTGDMKLELSGIKLEE